MPHELDVQVSPASALTRQRNVSLPNSASLLSLQTKVGNRAVCSLVAQSSPSPVLLIQRNGGGTKRGRDGEESSKDDDSEKEKKRPNSGPGSAAAASPDVEMADAGPAAEGGVPAEEDVEMPEVPRPTEDRSADVAGGAAIPGGPSSGAAAAVMAALAAAQQALVPAGEAAAQAPQQSLADWTAERARAYIAKLAEARQALFLLAKQKKDASDNAIKNSQRIRTRHTKTPEPTTDLVNPDAYKGLENAFESLFAELNIKKQAAVITLADLKQLGARFKRVREKGEEAFKPASIDQKSASGGSTAKPIYEWKGKIEEVSPTLSLEGLVVKYKDRPVEGLDADHQPNNDLYQLLARHPVFQNSEIAGVAAKRSDEAWTILLTPDRHEKGRTWGTKAVGVREWFVEEVCAKKEDMTANGGFAIQALKVLHESLKADVKQIKDLATIEPYVRNPQQNEQVKKGEDQILSKVTDQIAGWIGAMPSVPVTTGVAERHCQTLSALSQSLQVAADE